MGGTSGIGPTDPVEAVADSLLEAEHFLLGGLVGKVSGTAQPGVLERLLGVGQAAPRP